MNESVRVFYFRRSQRILAKFGVGAYIRICRNNLILICVFQLLLIHYMKLKKNFGSVLHPHSARYMTFEAAVTGTCPCHLSTDSANYSRL